MENNIYNIEDFNDFLRARQMGYLPLMDLKFKIPIKLRVEIQNSLFGKTSLSKGKIPVANDRFYHYVWNNKPHVCEETMAPLQGYSARFISHILTKGAYPEMAHDPRNVNILSLGAHQRWEDVNKRRGMRIYAKNMRIIELLTSEYNLLRYE